MKVWQVSFGLAAILSLSLFGCGADTLHSAPVSSQQQTVNPKGIDMMINEIYGTKIIDIRSQEVDVSSIVLKYLPVGTTKEYIMDFIKNKFKVTENSYEKLAIHHRKGEGYLGSRRDVNIIFYFDKNKQLNRVFASLDKSNNL